MNNSKKLVVIILSTLSPLCLKAQDNLFAVKDLLKLNSCGIYNEACMQTNYIKSKLSFLIKKQIVTEQQVRNAIKDNKINDLLLDAQVLEKEYGSGDTVCGETRKGGD